MHGDAKMSKYLDQFVIRGERWIVRAYVNRNGQRRFVASAPGREPIHSERRPNAKRIKEAIK